MTNDIYLIGEVGWEITLNGVIESVAQSDKDKPLDVYIHSVGGSVYEGIAIYTYLKGLDQEVNTHSSGLVASIASIIYLAGKHRRANKYDHMLIHLPMTFWSDGTAEDLEKDAKELRSIEETLCKIYAAETNLTEEEALIQMKLDEMIPVDRLLEMGFVTEQKEFKAVAKMGEQNTKRNMSENKDRVEVPKGIWNKILAAVGAEKSEPVNKLVVKTADDTELTFPDLEEGAEPSVGDMAEYDGQSAEGAYSMPDGRTFRFEKGELLEIIEKEEEEEEDLQAKIADLEASNLALEASNLKLTNKLTSLKNMASEVVIDVKEKQTATPKGFKSVFGDALK